MGRNTGTMVEELPENQQRKYGCRPRYPLWTAQRVLEQTLLGLDVLNRDGIFHSNNQPSNKLFLVRTLDNITEDVLGQDDETDAFAEPAKRKDINKNSWAPTYIVLSQL